MAYNYPQYYQETGDYIDYVENEDYCEPAADVTELYARKVPFAQSQQQFAMCPPQGYCYGNVQQCQRQTHRSHVPRTLSIAPYNPPLGTQSYESSRICQRCPMPTNSYNEPPSYADYDVSYQNVDNHHTVYGDATLEKHRSHKKHPVTLKAQKYYKVPQNKRSSALSLPVACQPDPVAVRRPRRLTVPDSKLVKPPLEGTKIDTKDAEESSNSGYEKKKGDGNAVSLEKILSDIEKDIEEQKDEDETTKPDMMKFCKYLRPKVPASIKAKREEMARNVRRASFEKNKKKTEPPNEKEDENSLEKLLNQLKKCELVNGREERTNENVKNVEEKTTENNNGEKNCALNDEASEIARSFNYENIARKVRPCRRIDNEKNRKTSIATMPTDSENKIARYVGHAMAPLDDQGALELHRSKSYIVDLIDRALSKELGTVPGDRCLRKEFEQMSPQKVVRSVNRQSHDQELCYEITAALTDSLISNATAPDERLPPQSKTVCNCASEPLYVKQLRQLRWGHLRHIQREVRRLEDLERFLDSCTCPGDHEELQ